MSPLQSIAIVVFTVLLSAFASGAETAVVSCSKVRLRAGARAVSRRARMLEGLISSPERFFAAVLVVNNVAVIYEIK